MARCTRCDADWSAGALTIDCPQCGGGALDHACLHCGGRCGARWARVVDTSQETGEATWIGGCALPATEREAALREQLEQARRGG